MARKPTPAAPAAPQMPSVEALVAEIQLYEQEKATWCQRGQKIIKRYKDERSSSESTTMRFNVLWSNVQTLLPALYARNPKPDISRRHKGDDPVGRVAAQVLERSVAFFVGSDKFRQTVRQSVLDYLLPGRGTVWVRYVPHFRDLALQTGTGTSPDVAADGAQATDDLDEEAPKPQEVAYEEAVTDYVHWDDFGHTVARTWEEVGAAWRRVFLAKPELEARFGEAIAATIPLDHKPNGDKAKPGENAKATIYEVWDKRTRRVTWLHKDVPTALDQRDDPLKLDDFWPFPRPLFANLANDSLIPTPDFVQYQDQATELDNLTRRIDALTKALKIAGVYDQSAQGLDRLLSEGVENELIPVEKWAVHAEKGGLKGVIDFLPIKEVAEVLIRLYEAREKVKQDLYEITGISDIVRGATVASETATAQQLKSNFATLRLSDRQDEVQRFARDLVVITAQIIAGLFQLDTIRNISGVQLLTRAEAEAMKAQLAQTGGEAPDILSEPTWEDVEQLLRNQASRCFRIDIETDSTIKADQQAEKAERTEFLQAAAGFLQQAVAAGQQSPALVPLLGQLLMFGVRAFPVGKEMESAFTAALAKMEKAAAQPAEPRPDPEMEKVKQQAAMDQQRLAAEQERYMAKLASDERRLIAESQHRAALEAERERVRSEENIRKAMIDADAKVRAAAETAAINARASIATAEINAEAKAAQPAKPAAEGA